MSVLCIGGICIPYSVFFPLLVLILKWLAPFLPEGIFGAKKKEPTGEEKALATLPFGVFDLDSELQYKAALASNVITFLWFTSDWCVPCKKLQPIWEELATKQHPELRWMNIDVDKFGDIAAQHAVLSLPSFFAYVGNQELGSLSGKDSKEDGALQEFVRKAVAAGAERQKAAGAGAATAGSGKTT